jgi:hypothetical protein
MAWCLIKYKGNFTFTFTNYITPFKAPTLLPPPHSYHSVNLTTFGHLINFLSGTEGQHMEGGLYCNRYFTGTAKVRKVCTRLYPKVPDWLPGARTENGTALSH